MQERHVQMEQQLQVQLPELPLEWQLPGWQLPDLPRPPPDMPPVPPQPAHMGPLAATTRETPGVEGQVQERHVQMEQQQQMQLPELPLEGQLPGWQLPELPWPPPDMPPVPPQPAHMGPLPPPPGAAGPADMELEDGGQHGGADNENTNDADDTERQPTRRSVETSHCATCSWSAGGGHTGPPFVHTRARMVG